MISRLEGKSRLMTQPLVGLNFCPGTPNRASLAPHHAPASDLPLRLAARNQFSYTSSPITLLTNGPCFGVGNHLRSGSFSARRACSSSSRSFSSCSCLSISCPCVRALCRRTYPITYREFDQPTLIRYFYKPNKLRGN